MYAMNGPNWVELQPGRDFVEASGTVSSYGTVMNWSAQQRTAKGIKAIVDDLIPSGKVQIGSTLIDDNGTPRRQWNLIDAAPPSPPEVISDRQFAQQLAILGTITEAEAIAWAARGDLPEALEQAIATLPTEGGVQFTARMLLSSATAYHRSHPMTATLGGILGYDAADLDNLWRAAFAL